MLASGSGTILAAIVESGIDVAVVVVDRPCRAVDVAEAAGISTAIVKRDSFGADFDRVEHTHRVIDALEPHHVELVAMAGFGTVLEKPIFDCFAGRIVNTHPSLLPAFSGWHAVEEALAAGAKVTGCTVHVATLEVDAGPIVAQEAVPIRPGDDVTRLHERIKEVERRLYPDTIRRFIEERV